VGNWYEESFNDAVKFGVKVRRTLRSNRSAFQQIDLIETEFFGRALVLDGLFMTSEKDEFFYHEMLVHPAVCAVPEAKQVLVIGGGDGGTVRELFRYPQLERVEMVEIDGEVVDVCREYLPSIASGFDDPRLRLHIQDGIKFVAEAADQTYDIVILDGSDPVGPAEGLYNETFYQDVRRVLRPDGIFALQSESPVLQADVFRAVQRTLRGIFEDVRPYLGTVPIYGAAMWSWTLARPRGDVLPLDLGRLEPHVKQLHYLNPGVCKASFELPNFVRRLAAP
jgi:spermidine synthase